MRPTQRRGSGGTRPSLTQACASAGALGGGAAALAIWGEPPAASTVAPLGPSEAGAQAGPPEQGRLTHPCAQPNGLCMHLRQRHCVTDFSAHADSHGSGWAVRNLEQCRMCEVVPDGCRARSGTTYRPGIAFAGASEPRAPCRILDLSRVRVNPNPMSGVNRTSEPSRYSVLARDKCKARDARRFASSTT